MTATAQVRRLTRLPRRLAWALLISAAIPLVALIILRGLDVPLGEPGRTVYSYSAFVLERLTLRTWPVLVGGALAAVSIRPLAASDGSRRAAGVASFFAAITVLAIWTWWSPIAALGQHLLNLGSPGQDGAFVIESRTQPTARRYLQTFDQRVMKPPDEMGSTRVISNPPGATLFVYAVNAISPPRALPPGDVERWLMRDYGLDSDGARSLSPAVRVSMVLTAAWAMSAVFAYLLGTLFVSRAAAAVFALAVTFNPCTVEFTPGKDPAQLLTLNAMLWAWFAASRTESASLAVARSAAAGVLLGIGLIVGLVHAWVALIAVLATAWVALRRHRLPVMLVRQLLPMAVASLATLGILSLILHWNAFASLWLVARRFNQVQRLIYPNRALWLAIGLPIFLLFLSPGTIVPVWLALRRRRPSADPISRPLLFATLGVMAFTYLVGVSYELPRLWVAFLPTLTLGGMAAVPLFRRSGSDAPAHRASPILLVLALSQIVFTTIHFSLMDARQSEERVTSGRLFSSAIVRSAPERPTSHGVASRYRFSASPLVILFCSISPREDRRCFPPLPAWFPSRCAWSSSPAAGRSSSIGKIRSAST